MARIGIYAPHAGGHRFKYVQHLIMDPLMTQCEVVLLTTETARNSSDYGLHLAPFENQFKTQIIREEEIHPIVEHSKNLQTDLFVIPDGDYFAWRHAWLYGWHGPGQVSALVMRPSGQRKGQYGKVLESLAKSTLFAIGNRRKKVHLFRLGSAIQSTHVSKNEIADPITFTPDAELRGDLSVINDTGKDIKWVGIVGYLDERKNIPLVLESALQVQTDRFGIVLAGQFEPGFKSSVLDVVRRLRCRDIPVIVVDLLLTDGQLDALLRQLHCVVLAHSNEGPSGIFGKSVEAGTFVVAAGARSLRRDCALVPQTSRWTPLSHTGLTSSIEFGLSNAAPTRIPLNTASQFSAKMLLRKSSQATTC